ncbi:MAG: hypothetical protein QMD04_11695 [Anaerolineales bacterium]|nr:hypothetical protein [Anaerolineales bacterium]
MDKPAHPKADFHLRAIHPFPSVIAPAPPYLGGVTKSVDHPHTAEGWITSQLDELVYGK